VFWPLSFFLRRSREMGFENSAFLRRALIVDGQILRRTPVLPGCNHLFRGCGAGGQFLRADEFKACIADLLSISERLEASRNGITEQRPSEHQGDRL
jgi:hypothetical protein